MTDARFDSRGCLTPSGVAALQRAPAGQAPIELARHLASCPRCQGRLLSRGHPPREAAAGPSLRSPPAAARIWRAAAMVVGALALALAALLVLAVLRR